jgi:hypothetical protein
LQGSAITLFGNADGHVFHHSMALGKTDSSSASVLSFDVGPCVRCYGVPRPSHSTFYSTLKQERIEAILAFSRNDPTHCDTVLVVTAFGTLAVLFDVGGRVERRRYRIQLPLFALSPVIRSCALAASCLVFCIDGVCMFVRLFDDAGVVEHVAGPLMPRLLSPLGGGVESGGRSLSQVVALRTLTGDPNKLAVLQQNGRLWVLNIDAKGFSKLSDSTTTIVAATSLKLFQNQWTTKQALETLSQLMEQQTQVEQMSQV